MDDNIITRRKIENMYHDLAKQLYNTALYAVGDETMAEQAAAVAFADAFDLLQDKSDIVLFEKQCYRLLYRRVKKVRQSSEYSLSPAVFSKNLTCVSAHKALSEMLTGLEFEERYIVLLFCLNKYSVRQIAGITRLPCFLIEKRLFSAVSKAMQ